MRRRTLAALIVASTLIGLALGPVGRATADPASFPTVLAGAGSDTTQDVLDAIATNIGPVGGTQEVGAWDAFKPGTNVVTRDDITPKAAVKCTNVTRPYNLYSTDALRRSLSGTAAVGGLTSTAGGMSPHPVPLGSGCFDFAQSSIFPGVKANSVGLLQYVPFGKDALTMAVGPGTGTNMTAIVDSFTLTQLWTLYSSGQPVTVNGRTYDPKGETGIPIRLLVPSLNSGDRTFFASVVGINPFTIPAWVHDTYVPAGGGPPQPVWDNNGTAVELDHHAIMPFSVAQWISQANGHNDRRHGAVLQTIDGVAPISSGKINTSFSRDLMHEVYNVIPFSATTATTSDLFKVFVATSGPFRLCGQTATITNYGFAPLTAHTCGQIDPALRAFGNDGTF